MKADLAASMVVCDRHPAIPLPKRLAHHVWKRITVAVFFGGPIYALWGGVHWAVIGIVLGFMLMAAVQRTAASFVLETAQASPAFKAEMIRTGVIAEAQDAQRWRWVAGADDRLQP